MTVAAVVVGFAAVVLLAGAIALVLVDEFRALVGSRRRSAWDWSLVEGRGSRAHCTRRRSHLGGASIRPSAAPGKGLRPVLDDETGTR